MSTNHLRKKSSTELERHRIYESISRVGWKTAAGAVALGVAGNIAFAIISLLPQ